MIITQIFGGLGNQMFQYAFGKALALTNDMPLYIDKKVLENYSLQKGGTIRDFELDCFSISLIKANDQITSRYYKNSIYYKILKRIKIIKTITDVNGFQCVPKLKKGTYFVSGYWQSEDYFSSYESNIRDDFKFTKQKNEITNKLGCQIQQHHNSVSIHVRRGDYITSKEANSFHGVCSLDYYKQAVSLIKSKIENPFFYLFSDEPDWIKENFQFILDNACIVNHNKGEDCWQDMYLMSLCQHNVIANSSFSWWGAWLNSHKNKIVIAPKQWFKCANICSEEIIPKKWVQI